MIVPERGSKAYSDPAKPDRLSWAMIAFACVLQIVLGSALAWTHLPLCDEGFYGVPAHMLSVTGKLTNPVMEPAQVNYLRGIDRDFYWMVPMGMVLQAAAFKVFGFGLLVQRGLSVVCGLGALLFWTMALRHLVTDRVAALAAVEVLDGVEDGAGVGLDRHPIFRPQHREIEGRHDGRQGRGGSLVAADLQPVATFAQMVGVVDGPGRQPVDLGVEVGDQGAVIVGDGRGGRGRERVIVSHARVHPRDGGSPLNR